MNVNARTVCANLICSFRDRRLNSTQGEIRVGPSHQVKQILVAFPVGFYFLLFCWSFILLCSSLESLLSFREFYINAGLVFFFPPYHCILLKNCYKIHIMSNLPF